jgi:hypothetical protein
MRITKGPTMPEPSNTPNLDRLHDLALQSAGEFSSSARVEENYKGADLYVNLGNDLEILRVGGCTVIRGVLGDVKVGDLKKGAVITISFDGGETEPSSFLRWDKTRSDTGEGYSIPKRQKERIAGHLIDRFAS